MTEARDGQAGAGTGSGPLLLVFAHPDDETFGCAGVMAAARDRDVPVTLISATRGEAGQTSVGAVGTSEILVVVRELELRAAAAAVGVIDVRFLGYRDSGMAGTPENDDPRAFIHVPEEQAVAALVAHLRAVRPATIVTFGPDGMYGHPDHLAVHRATVAAVHRAADAAYRPELGAWWPVRALYFSAVPREALVELAKLPNSPLRHFPPDQLARIGVPRAEITTVIDIAPYHDAKLAAILAHRTQVGEGGPLAGVPEEHRELQLTREHFVRVPLPWDDRSAPTGDLLAALAAARPVPPA